MIEHFTIAEGFVQMLTPAEVAAGWKELEYRLQEVMDKDFCGNLFTPAHVLSGLIAETYQCWVVFKGGELNAFFITEIQVYPKARVLAIPFAGGTPGLAVMKEIFQHMLEVARAKDCAYLRASGRKGWVKVMGDACVSTADDFCEVRG